MLRTASAFTPVVVGIPAEEPDHFLTCPVCGQTLVQPDVVMLQQRTILALVYKESRLLAV